MNTWNIRHKWQYYTVTINRTSNVYIVITAFHFIINFKNVLEIPTTEKNINALKLNINNATNNIVIQKFVQIIQPPKGLKYQRLLVFIKFPYLQNIIPSCRQSSKKFARLAPENATNKMLTNTINSIYFTFFVVYKFIIKIYFKKI